MAVEAGAEQVAEERVVAVPAVVLVVDDQDAAALQLDQVVGGPVVLGQQLGQLRREAIGDAGAQQEPLDGVVLADEQLTQQVVGHDRGRAGGAAHEAPRVGVRLQRTGGETQAGGPPVGPGPQRLDVVTAEGHLVQHQQLGGLRRVERQVGVADLGEAPVEAQVVEADGRVGPARQHHVELRRSVVQQVGGHVDRAGRTQGVDVVEHQHLRRIVALGQAAQQLVELVEDRDRRSPPGRVVQPSGQRRPQQRHQATGVVVALVEAEPGDGPAHLVDRRRQGAGQQR